MLFFALWSLLKLRLMSPGPKVEGNRRTLDASVSEAISEDQPKALNW